MRIAGVARSHRFGTDIPVPFLCECDDDGCSDLLRLTIPVWEDARLAATYVVAPGHEIADAELVRVRDSCWLYRRP